MVRSGSMSGPELLFPTPLWRFRHPTPDALTPLAAHVLQLQERDPVGVAISNQGGWHSAVVLLRDPVLAELFGWVTSCCLTALRDYGWDMNRAKPSFNNAWAIVNRKGHGNRAHLHSNSLFSGVVYLKVPDASGAIRFLDPRGGAQVLLPPLTNDDDALSRGRVVVSPEVGLLLLFPAWLWHEVEPGQNEEPRVSISFNLGMQAVRSSGGL